MIQQIELQKYQSKFHKLCLASPRATRVGKTRLPCHDLSMIMAKHGHDHTMMTAWRPCFLAWSS